MASTFWQVCRRPLGAGLVAALLAGCGGGGGGDPAPTFSDAPTGPPATAATVADTSNDAIAVTEASVAAADGMVARRNALSGLTAVFGQPITGASPSGALAIAALLPAGLKRPMAVTTEVCTEIVDAPCSGTATLDTNIDDNATTVNAGQYLDATFNGISGLLLGDPVTLGGRLRVEFLTGLNLNQPSFAGLALRIVFRAFVGTVRNDPFGPIDDTLDLIFDAQARPSLVAGGARYGSLAGVDVTGSGSYRIASGDARLGYGSTGAGYVDVALNGWQASGGRPAAGSAAVVTVPGTRATVTAVAAGPDTVSYDVSIALNGNASLYRVVATYPSGGGAPTYAIGVP